jgi:uncharacterized Ntn-hydrolase superfamily protein
MKCFLLCFTFVLTIHLAAQDTFSIIAADPETGEIGAAGATCVDGIASFGGIQILNQIIPGRGGVNAQAYICVNPHVNLDLAIEQMGEGLSPEEVIDYLVANDACFSQNFNPAYRQYGIVDFDTEGNVRTAGFTGASADDYKEHRTGLTYAVQGNILLGPEVIDGMEDGFNNTEGSLAQKLMAAMQGANIAGADVRCLDRGTSSTSAFLRVVRPTDDVNAPYLNLSILEMPFGEEPIDSLQALFSEWELVNDTRNLTEANVLAVYPNPTGGRVNLQVASDATITRVAVYTLYGQMMEQNDYVVTNEVTLETMGWPAGTYYLKVQLSEGQMLMRKLVKD